MAKEICEKVSNAAASCVRRTMFLRKGFEKMRNLTKKSADSLSYSFKRMKAKMGNLRKRVKDESRLASCDEKQKTVFAELGREVFYGNDDKKNNAIELEQVKKLLKEAKDYEKQKQEIMDEISIQKRKMDEIVIFRKAILNLENSDPRIRRVAIRVLDRLGSREAVSYLTRALEDTDPEVRHRAREVLHKLLEDIKDGEKKKLQKENSKKESSNSDSVEA